MYEIKNDSEILLYDEILRGWTARNIVERIAQNQSPITLRINSSGGDVFEALAVYNQLKSRGNVTVYVDGVCASAASIIAMSGHVKMPANAFMMIHRVSGMIDGNSEALKEYAALLDKVQDSIIGIYSAKTGLEPGRIREMMTAETWMSASEAHDLGFADEVIDEVVTQEPQNKTYEDGVRDERERLRALDGISMRGREAIIARAKYETCQSARDVALEILRMDSRHQDAEEIPVNLSQRYGPEDRLSDMIEKLRGVH